MTRSPAELAARLDEILLFTGRVVAVVPTPYLEHRRGERDPSLADLAFGVFERAVAFVDAMDRGRVPDWAGQPAPSALRDGGALARYGGLVRGRVTGWFEGAGPGEYGRAIAVAAGSRTGHELLDLTVREAARSLAELHALVDGLGVTTPGPLPAAARDSLPEGGDA